MLQNIQARQKADIVHLHKEALACGIIILQFEKKLDNGRETLPSRLNGAVK